MIDTYTKVCLTIIAISLSIIGLRGLPVIDPAYAQDKVQKVTLCNAVGTHCLKYTSSILRM